MKQYQVNNIVGALGSYLSARRNRGAATNLMQSMEQDPNMDAYERKAYANAFSPDYSNVGEVSGEYLGYRQKKKQMEMEAENQRLMRAQQAQNVAQMNIYRQEMLAIQRKKQRQAALKDLYKQYGEGKDPSQLIDYGKALGLGDGDMMDSSLLDEDSLYEEQELEGEDDMDVNSMFERLY